MPRCCSEDEGADAARAQLGTLSWRQALGSFLRKVHADPIELATALLTAVGQLVTAVEQAGDEGGAAAWLQTLGTTALLLDLLPDARPALRASAAFTLEEVLQRAIRPVLHHDDLLVRLTHEVLITQTAVSPQHMDMDEDVAVLAWHVAGFYPHPFQMPYNKHSS